MKSYNEIYKELKSLPAIMSLHRILLRKATPADFNLIGSILADDYYARPFLVEFNSKDKTVIIAHSWCETTEKYYAVSAFYLYDVFINANHITETFEIELRNTQ